MTPILIHTFTVITIRGYVLKHWLIVLLLRGNILIEGHSDWLHIQPQRRGTPLALWGGGFGAEQLQLFFDFTSWPCLCGPRRGPPRLSLLQVWEFIIRDQFVDDFLVHSKLCHWFLSPSLQLHHFARRLVLYCLLFYYLAA